jgi:glutaredoxin
MPGGRVWAAAAVESPLPMRDTFSLPVLTVYRRDGCHLCDDARQILQDLLEERARRGEPTPRVKEIDIDADPALHARYFLRIPVFAVGDDEIDIVTSSLAARRFLERTLPQLV